MNSSKQSHVLTIEFNGTTRRLEPGQSIFAPCIIYRGVTYRNHIASISNDGIIKLAPFVAETPSTLCVATLVHLKD